MQVALAPRAYLLTINNFRTQTKMYKPSGWICFLQSKNMVTRIGIRTTTPTIAIRRGGLGFDETETNKL